MRGDAESEFILIENDWKKKFLKVQGCLELKKFRAHLKINFETEGKAGKSRFYENIFNPFRSYNESLYKNKPLKYF